MVNRKRRPNLTDIAEHAGVSVATVDRVLNERGRVRAATATRIRKVAEDLGFEPSVFRDTLKLKILLQDPDHLYYQDIGRHLALEADAAKRLGVSVDVSYLADTSETRVAAEIDRLAKDADALAGVFVQHTIVQESISRVLDQGKPVVTLLTDIRHPGRTRYVGLDNRMVGRTAGYLMGRLTQRREGKVVITTETLNYLGLEEREMGFRSMIKEKFPHLQILSVIERGEDRQLSRDQTLQFLKEPTAIGIYNAGGRNSEVVAAVERAGRSSQDIVVIGSELTEVSRRLLLSEKIDVVISFPAAIVARETIRALLVAVGRAEPEAAPLFQPFQIYVGENAI